VIKSLIDRKEHAQWEREEVDGIEQDKRTGKVRFKNCYTGCPYQAIYETNTSVRGGAASEAALRARDTACRECKLPTRPVWEVGVVDRARFISLPAGMPYWLSVGVGFVKAQNG